MVSLTDSTGGLNESSNLDNSQGFEVGRYEGTRKFDRAQLIKQCVLTYRLVAVATLTMPAMSDEKSTVDSHLGGEHSQPGTAVDLAGQTESGLACADYERRSRASRPAYIGMANALLANDKGLLAVDESPNTCNQRFAAFGIAQSEAARRAYRELILTSPGLGESIGGVILHEETLHQCTKQGQAFVEVLHEAGIVTGVKVDIGTKALAMHPGEKITEGLDGLHERLNAYFELGARFAKWRAVITIGHGLPSLASIEANAHALARYAVMCQEAGLVPVVEPEVLMEGSHTIRTCLDVTEKFLRAVFIQLDSQGVRLEGMILKPNMVLSGIDCSLQVCAEEIADVTVDCLRRTVPAAVSGIAFLSGGQPAKLATQRLSAMNLRCRSRLPWPLGFSFARAIQQPALEIWRGSDANIVSAQQALLHRARCNRDARRGTYEIASDQQ